MLFKNENPLTSFSTINLNSFDSVKDLVITGSFKIVLKVHTKTSEIIKKSDLC